MINDNKYYNLKNTRSCNNLQVFLHYIEACHTLLFHTENHNVKCIKYNYLHDNIKRVPLWCSMFIIAPTSPNALCQTWCLGCKITHKKSNKTCKGIIKKNESEKTNSLQSVGTTYNIVQYCTLNIYDLIFSSQYIQQ